MKSRLQEYLSSGLSLPLALLICFAGISGCGKSGETPAPVTEAPSVEHLTTTPPAGLSDAQLENIVRRSYQYVAMYNVNNKFALAQGGWNSCVADTRLKDHTMTDIARPNNDTLYDACLLDLRTDAIILEIPALDSNYVSLMVTGYDHHVNIPLSTRLGDFARPVKFLLYSARTQGYGGETVEGVDRYFESTGDFVSAVFRVMPHLSDPPRFERITEQMKLIKAVTLSEFLGIPAKPAPETEFPAVGATDADVFGTNLLEVMQFVFNHTTFDPDDESDRAVLEAYWPLGLEPGKAWNPGGAQQIDGARLRATALRIQGEGLAMMADESKHINQARMFQPKGKSDPETILLVSIIGPIGVPQEEAVYPAVTTTDGQTMNALHDYVIRMSKDELPPANAFWSLTLYDLDNGFFIPNDRKKYSVGENAGMKLDEDGGIAIYIAADKPEGVPEENWLPINRDLNLSAILRIYVPDLDRLATWKTPKAEKLAH